MTIEEGLTAYLLSVSAVSSLIGDRLHPDRLPNDTEYPCSVYSRTTGTRVGTMPGPTGTAHPIFQFDHWGKTKASAIAVANAIRPAIVAVAAPWRTTSLMGTVPVEATLQAEGEESSYDPDLKLYRHTDFFEIWHSE